MSKAQRPLIRIDADVVVNGDASIASVSAEVLEAWDADKDIIQVKELAEACGTAKRAPGDKPDPEIATLLALGRALQSVGRQLENRANGYVKHADDIRADRQRRVEAEQVQPEPEPVVVARVSKKATKKAVAKKTTRKKTTARRGRPTKAQLAARKAAATRKRNREAAAT